MSWYTNPWVVGIIGSIPGGFLVNWLTGLVLGKRENREYLQKVNGANREVVYAVRPGISEGEIPSSAVLSALRNATARRFGVEATSLYSASEIAEELTKEVMDSSFISSAQKQEYCQRLSALVQAAPDSVPEETLDVGVRRVVTAEYRERLISTMGSLLGVLTVTITAMMSLLELVRSKNLGSEISKRKRRDTTTDQNDELSVRGDRVKVARLNRERKPPSAE